MATEALWTKERLHYNDQFQEITCNRSTDYLLLDFRENSPGSRYPNYKLYKTKIYNTSDWAYVMMIRHDDVPFVLTEDDALSILNNPFFGATMAYNIWMSRYR